VLQSFDAVGWVAGRASSHGGYGYGVCNEEGNRFLEMVQGLDMIVVNTCFRKREEQTHTHTHTHNRFTALLEYVRDHPGEQVPER